MKREKRSENWEIIESQTWEVNGIKLGYAASRFSKHTIHRAHNDQDLVRLHFGLQGDYAFTYKQLNKTYELAGGHHNLMYSPGIDLEFFNKTLDIETFGVDFPKNQFIQFMEDGDDPIQRFTTDVIKGNPVILSDPWGTIDISIQKLIDEIKLNPYAGNLKRIFLLAKTLELLVVCIDQYGQLQKKSYRYIKTRADQAKIIAARDLINERITNPPSLSEVARSVGINEFKLKAGFKEMFQNTLFGYLTQRRLNIGGQYLQDTDKTITEIAHQLGYSSPQHFHYQFRKQMGMTPGEWRNK